MREKIYEWAKRMGLWSNFPQERPSALSYETRELMMQYLRDQFAMAAMQANLTRTGDWDEDDLAECAYRAADAMMKAREVK